MNHAKQGHPRWMGHSGDLVESSDKMWSTGGGNSKPLQYSCFESPMKSMKRQNDMTLEEEPSRLEYISGDEGSSSSRKNEETEPKWK